MKNLISFALILITLISKNLFAQVYPEPLKLNKNFLVHSAGLPEEYILFVPDSATQILFNPARANNFSTGFVYLNYLSDYQRPAVLYISNLYPYPINFFTIDPVLAKGNVYGFPSAYEENYISSKNPTFSIASLIKDGNSGWLLSLTNGINKQESDRNISNAESSNYFYNGGTFDELINSKESRKSETKDFITTLKISRIWGTGTNFSLGLFGILYQNDYAVKRDKELFRYNIFNTTSDSLKQRRLDKRLLNEYISHKDSRFAIGFEFSVNKYNWDYIASFSYQKNDKSQNINYSTYENIYDSTYSSVSGQWFVYKANGNFERIIEIENKPCALTLSNYFQHSANWLTPDDNVFISLDAFYSPDEKVYENMLRNSFARYNNGMLTNSDTSDQKQIGIVDGKSWGISASSGYALKNSFSDIYFLSGLMLRGSYRNFEDILDFSSVESVNKITSAGITFPAYIIYTPAEWFSVYGGLNYIYEYYLSELEQKTDIEISSSTSANRSINFNFSQKNSDWQSKKSIYIGCEFRHHSGLKIQLFFDKEVATIPDWNVSLGYHF